MSSNKCEEEQKNCSNNPCVSGVLHNVADLGSLAAGTLPDAYAHAI
jgi:hypothetical protein